MGPGHFGTFQGLTRIVLLIATVASLVFGQESEANDERRAMKMQVDGETLRVTEVTELGAANADTLRDEVRAALKPGQRNIDLDLSATAFLDSCGLGALVALHKTACSRRGLVRLLRPTPAVRQVLELTHMHRIFEVVTS